MGLNFTYEPGQTPLDPDETDGLRLPSISTQRELNEFEQLNIQEAVEWTLAKKFKKDQVFSETFIVSLHKKMYGKIWKWAGQFRKTEKNIGVAPYNIAIQLRQLIDDSIRWIENKIFSEDEIAVRFKHRIVSIHCFPNGNGRHSRLMADIIISKVFEKPVFKWGNENIQQENQTRRDYMRALKLADTGDFSALIAFARIG